MHPVVIPAVLLFIMLTLEIVSIVITEDVEE